MSGERRVRVLVVDDSAFARKVVREVLSADARIEVVGIAYDGLDALEKISQLKPDVVTLDLVMPELDGLGVLAALRAIQGAPRVIVVTTNEAESELGLAALDAGAIDLVHKPTAIATDRLYGLGAELVTKVVAAAAMASAERAGATAPPVSRSATEAPPPIAVAGTELLVIGASTGGPQAITRILTALPANLPVPIAVVLHMPPGYIRALAERLTRQSGFDVREAEEGLRLVAGRVVLGRAGVHLHVRTSAQGGGLVTHLEPSPEQVPHRPSVDELFTSAANACGRRLLGVVLTGMGVDGLSGAHAIHAAGGRVLAESAVSAVVDGMPRAVREAKLATAEAPLDAMAALIVSRL
jgi:two-component system chemotaxis response regulator CheB